MNEPNIEQYYQILNLEPGASAEDIEQAYLKLVGKKLRQGEKEELKTIREAYNHLIDYSQKQAEEQEQTEQENYQRHIAQLINNRLQHTRIRVKVNLNRDQLEIRVSAHLAGNPQKATKLIKNILQQLKLTSVEKVKLSGIKADKSIVWEREFIIYQNINNIKDAQKRSEFLMEKAENNTNTFAFPVAFLIAFAISLTEPLAWFIGMWVHELGHATIAWFSGYRAMITFGGTVTQLQRSPFVYLGILTLLGLLFWYGWKEEKRSAMILALILAIIQFFMTLVISRSTYRMLLAFGGIGGEFYLSTLFMISFYFRLPEKLRWEFWRYLALVIGAITFWSSFSKWHNISRGTEAIPWGTFWGGRGDSNGDLNVLRGDFGWHSQQIIDTYNHLGDLCLFAIVGFYLYFLLQAHPQWGFNIQQKLSMWFGNRN